MQALRARAFLAMGVRPVDATVVFWRSLIKAAVPAVRWRLWHAHAVYAHVPSRARHAHPVDTHLTWTAWFFEAAGICLRALAVAVRRRVGRFARWSRISCRTALVNSEAAQIDSHDFAEVFGSGAAPARCCQCARRGACNGIANASQRHITGPRTFQSEWCSLWQG